MPALESAHCPPTSPVSTAVNIQPAARKQSLSLQQPTDEISMNIDEIPGQNPKQAELIHVHVAARLPLPTTTKSSVVREKPRGKIIDAAQLGISLEPTRSAVDVSSV